MGNKVAKKLVASITDCGVEEQLSEHVFRLLKYQAGLPFRPLIVLCIGSDRYTGDALGPLVGSYLIEYTDAIVYGSLEEPVHAGNLVETVQTIHQHYFHPLIVAVDACLGKTGEIGNIEAWEGGVEAGIAVGNRLPCVGHISIVGVVNVGGQLGYLDLQSTPLSIVVKLSKVIGPSLAKAIGKLTMLDVALTLGRT